MSNPRPGRIEQMHVHGAPRIGVPVLDAAVRCGRYPDKRGRGSRFDSREYLNYKSAPRTGVWPRPRPGEKDVRCIYARG